MANCKSCSAEIEWANTMKGKRMPLRPDPNGEWVIIRPGYGVPVITLKIGTEPPEHRLAVQAQVISCRRYKPHFSDCPSAKAWRKTG